MKLELGDLYLRSPDLGDVDTVAEAVHESVETVGRWLPWCTPEYGPKEANEWIERTMHELSAESGFEFLIIDAATDRLLGSCGLNQIDRMFARANLGYWVRQSDQGRGIAPRVTRRVARFGFEECGLQRVEIVAAVDNLNSQRVAEKAGATREAVLRNRLIFRGAPVDAVMFSLIPTDPL